MTVCLLIIPSAGGLELRGWGDITPFSTLQAAKDAVTVEPGEEWRVTEEDGITEHALVGDVTHPTYGPMGRRTLGVYIIEMPVLTRWDETGQ